MHPPLETADNLSALAGIKHGFFGRRGGVSEGEFAALNISTSVGDDRANVVENLHRAVMALKGGPIPVALAHQVHGTDVHVLGEDHDVTSKPEADALVTARKGIALGILTADCVPVLLADTKAGIIGAVHAGWKGATGGVLARTLEAMVGLGATPSTITAAIGPSICLRNYEIGEEMAATIRAQFPQAAPFIRTEGFSKPHFDVPGLVLAQAQALGLHSVEAVGGCTYGQPEIYFSHRYATHHDTRAGRQVALIARS